jgi:hypothetical protein
LVATLRRLRIRGVARKRDDHHNIHVFWRISDSEVWSEVAFGGIALLVAAGVKLLIAGYAYGRFYLYVPSVQVEVVDVSVEMIFIGFGTLVNATLSWWRSQRSQYIDKDEAWSVAGTFLAVCAGVAIFVIVFSFSVWPVNPPKEWQSAGQQLSILGHYLLNNLIALVVLASGVSSSQKVRMLISNE